MTDICGKDLGPTTRCPEPRGHDEACWQWASRRAAAVDPTPFDPNECGNCGRCGHCDPPEGPGMEAPNAAPMVEAMDLFDRFWNATFGPLAEDWTAYGLTPDGSPCECGNCQTCGIRYALLWTHNLLSNPSLADLAERKRHEREERGRG